MRVPAGDIEELVLDRLRAFFSSETDVGDALASLHLDARALDTALRNAVELSQQWRAGKGKRLVIGNGAEAEVNAGLAAMITKAFAIRNPLLLGSDDSTEAMSGRLGMNKCRLTSLIRLSHLAPEIVGALLAARHPIELTPTRLLRLSRGLPHDWSEQRRFLGFPA
jgi:hypothetical protein